MTERVFETPCGHIHYWTNEIQADRQSLIFLPGLTADHRLFDKQVAYFRDRYNVLVWDAPGHAASWPFGFDFDLMDKARWLDGILVSEGIKKPILVGQSMEADLPYKIPCPAILICGRKDRAGSCIRYAKAWHKETGIPLEWIENAGHNANTDQPEIVNGWIEELAKIVRG